MHEVEDFVNEGVILIGKSGLPVLEKVSYVKTLLAMMKQFDTSFIQMRFIDTLISIGYTRTMVLSEFEALLPSSIVLETALLEQKDNVVVFLPHFDGYVEPWPVDVPYYSTTTKLVYYDVGSRLWVFKHGTILFNTINIWDTILQLLELSARSNPELNQYFFTQCMTWLIVSCTSAQDLQYLEEKFIPRLQKLVTEQCFKNNLKTIELDADAKKYLSSDLLRICTKINQVVSLQN